MIAEFVSHLMVFWDALDFLAGKWLFAHLMPVCLPLDIACDFYRYKYIKTYDSDAEKNKAYRSFKTWVMVKVGMVGFAAWNLFVKESSLSDYKLLAMAALYYFYVLLIASLYFYDARERWLKKKGKATTQDNPPEEKQPVEPPDPEFDWDDSWYLGSERRAKNRMNAWGCYLGFLNAAIILAVVLLVTGNLKILTGFDRIRSRDDLYYTLGAVAVSVLFLFTCFVVAWLVISRVRSRLVKRKASPPGLDGPEGNGGPPAATPPTDCQEK